MSIVIAAYFSREQQQYERNVFIPRVVYKRSICNGHFVCLSPSHIDCRNC